MSFDRIKKELLKSHEKARKEKKELFKNGFLSSWNEDAKQNAKDNILRLLREYLTPSKWEKWQSKKITFKEAQKIAFNRFVAEDEKNYQKQLLKIENVEKAEIPQYIKINIEWHKSPTWGYNPSCVINCSTFDYTRGSASGCGYDKESASISEATHNNYAILKILYEMEEKRLKQRKNPQSRHDFIGYGSGYGVLPYFEGGVGANCHINILKKYGYEITEAHGNTYDFYEARLCKKARKQSK